MRWRLLAVALLALAPRQLPPPNLVQNGDARAGDVYWTPSRHHKPLTSEGAKDASVEWCDGAPCFVLRNAAGWNQHIHLPENPAGKFLLIVARGSSERIPVDGSITGRPYLWARLLGVKPPHASVLQGMALRPKEPDVWGTMHGIFLVTADAQALHLMIGQAEARGTPQNGSAARVKDIEVRLFDTREQALTYLKIYEAQYEVR